MSTSENSRECFVCPLQLCRKSSCWNVFYTLPCMQCKHRCPLGEKVTLISWFFLTRLLNSQLTPSPIHESRSHIWSKTTHKKSISAHWMEHVNNLLDFGLNETCQANVQMSFKVLLFCPVCLLALKPYRDYISWYLLSTHKCRNLISSTRSDLKKKNIPMKQRNTLCVYFQIQTVSVTSNSHVYSESACTSSRPCQVYLGCFKSRNGAASQMWILCEEWTQTDEEKRLSRRGEGMGLEIRGE